MSADMIELWACEDCYTAHHYGDTEHDGEHFAGESDQPADREPWGQVGDDVEVWDDTCSNHYYGQPQDDPECDTCGRPSEDGTGVDEFSWSPCHGCGSGLGGRRFRMGLEYR